MAFRITLNSATKLSRLLNSTQSGGGDRSQHRDTSFSRVRLASAPSGGIPARVGTTLGEAQCSLAYYDLDGAITISSTTIQVFNVEESIVGAGDDPEDRLVVVSKHSNGALVLAGGAGLTDCDPFWDSLTIVELQTGDLVPIIRDGCLYAAEIRACQPDDPSGSSSSAPTSSEPI